MRVHISKPPAGDFLPVLTKELAGSPVMLTLGPEMPPPADTAVLVTGRPSAAELATCPGAKALVVPYAGVPQATVDLVRSRPGLRLYNLHHNAAPTAEHAVALLLAAARRVVPCDAALRRNDWTARYEDERGMLLDGRRALILGYGQIGQRVARILTGFGMTVTAIRRSGSRGDEPVPTYPPSELRGLLPSADVLIICLPSTPATERLLGAGELALLPSHAILVNVARGGIIDEKALFTALRDGRIAAAGLDVWWNYPAGEASRAATSPSRFPFGELDNVVLSPHRAGHCDQTERLRATHLARLLLALSSGSNAPGALDVEQGY